MAEDLSIIIAAKTPQVRPDVIERGLLSVERAEELLRIYQVDSRSFPFVHVPSNATISSLRRDRPFLLLNVLTMASQRNNELQTVLEQEVREVLGTKVISDGEQSLDLLQGLMVYLAWYIL